ncbi:hypothetical protein GGR51DRAFT_561526 [Nemania sp. FL0031]|nr:hypothetical protein GGR51DRAFT_561526 [Nemania sp. FL0031]
MAELATGYELPVAQGTEAPKTPSTPADQNGDLGYFEHSLAKKGRKILVYQKILEIDTGIKMDKSKTTGTISIKNSNAILMSAHSGYSSGGSGDESACLNTAKWNHLALHHLAKQVRFRFPANIRDNAGGAIPEEHRGRAHAGHVEVLLACWFVVDTVRQTFGFIDKPEEWLVTQIKRLKGADLGHKRSAFITIDNEPCRTCLQLLNRVSQSTGILFMVIGSRGIGPVLVRVDGQRRDDQIGEVFTDSENDDEMEEAHAQVEEAEESCNMVALQDPPTPAGPMTPMHHSRHSRLYWENNAQQWTPEDPQKLLSSYKKKTPVYEFPGYDNAPRPLPDSITRGNRDSSTGNTSGNDAAIEDVVSQEDNPAEWEDLGDGLMVRFPDTTKRQQNHDSVKRERTPPPFNQPYQSQRDTLPTQDESDGQMYARVAYEALRESIEHEMDYEVIRRPRRNEQYRRQSDRYYPRPPHRLDHVSGRIMPRRPQPVLQLREYYHHPIGNTSDESVLTSRYAILRPKHGVHKLRDGR